MATDRARRAAGVPDDSAGVEWRVEWRREDWKPATGTKSRTFARRPDLDRFVARQLLAGDRPDLAPISFLRITWRHVGPWQTGPAP